MTTKLRVVCEIGFALFVSWLVLEISINDSMLTYLIVGIAVVFIPVWLFAIFGTDMLSLQTSTQSSRCLTRGEIGILIMLIAVSLSDSGGGFLLGLAFVFFGFLVRLSTTRID